MKRYLLVLMFLCSTSLGWAMEQSEQEGPNMELLQFEGISEVDIVEMVETLMLEATPQKQMSAPPAGIEKWSVAKRLECDVNKQENPQDRTRLSRIFRLIRQANQTPPFIDSTDHVIPPTSLRELDVLVGSGYSQEHRAHSLANRIDHTQLHIGSATKMRHLVQVKNKKNLKALQKVIKAMNAEVEIPENLRSLFSQKKAPLYEVIKAFIEEVKPVEDTFLSFWINEEGYDILDHWLKDKESKYECVNFSRWLVELQQIKNFILPALSPCVAVAAPIAGSVVTANPFVITYACLSIPLTLYKIPKTCKNYPPQIMSLYLIQKRLIGLAIFVEKLNNLQKLLKDSNFSQKLIDSLVLPTVTPKMQKLTNLLNKTTFKSKPSFWSHWGNICVAYRLMLKQRNEFINAYLGLGTIDFVTSLSLLLASSTKKSPYCFAKYKDDDTNNAGIEAQACWSPLLDRKSVVTNDVTLGGNNQRTFIITGPNARGKTTLMRSVAGAALLGSTLGIGSAKKLVIPANLNFLTSINIGDDPSKKLSLFKAVVARMLQIKRTLEQTKAARQHLVVTDEPFVGTDKALAEASARTFITSIAKKPNSLALFSSHLDVTHLGEKLPDLIANYHLASGYKFVSGVDPNPEKYYQIALEIIAAHNDDEFVTEIEKELATIRSAQGQENKSKI